MIFATFLGFPLLFLKSTKRRQGDYISKIHYKKKLRFETLQNETIPTLTKKII